MLRKGLMELTAPGAYSEIRLERGGIWGGGQKYISPFSLSLSLFLPFFSFFKIPFWKFGGGEAAPFAPPLNTLLIDCTWMLLWERLRWRMLSEISESALLGITFNSQFWCRWIHEKGSGDVVSTVWYIYSISFYPSAHKQLSRHLPNHFSEFPCKFMWLFRDNVNVNGRILSVLYV